MFSEDAGRGLRLLFRTCPAGAPPLAVGENIVIEDLLSEMKSTRSVLQVAWR